MKSKKLTSLALAAAMTATLFAGCGNNDEEAKNNPTTTPGTQDGDQQQGGEEQPGGVPLPIIRVRNRDIKFLKYCKIRIHYIREILDRCSKLLIRPKISDLVII